jgi:hypothetical protein
MQNAGLVTEKKKARLAPHQSILTDRYLLVFTFFSLVLFRRLPLFLSLFFLSFESRVEDRSCDVTFYSLLHWSVVASSSSMRSRRPFGLGKKDESCQKNGLIG